MKKCDKVAFDSLYDAKMRFNEIKSRGDKRSKDLTRTYQCEKCQKWHFTSVSESEWSKKASAFFTKIKKREENFINREAAYWKKKFGIKD